MNLKSIKESRNMTQLELATELKISRSSVAMWESGKISPRVEMLIKLSTLFNCTIDELVKGEKNEEKP